MRPETRSSSDDIAEFHGNTNHHTVPSAVSAVKLMTD
jgi:hypothetical protein